MNASHGNSFWLGVDLSQLSIEASLAPVGMSPLDWRDLPAISLNNSKQGLASLRRWLKAKLPSGARLDGICVESTGRLSQRFAAALRALAPAWPQTSIVNPKRPHDFSLSLGVRDKTDLIDARTLATFGALYRPGQTPPLSPAHQRLRELCRLRNSFVVERDALRNRRREIDDPEICRLLKRRLRQQEKDIKELEKKARQLLAADQRLHEDYQLLVSIKGIKFITAWILLAELGDLRQYSRGSIAAYVGLYPRQCVSGKTTLKKSRLVKGGGALVRKVLFNGARSILLSKNNTVKDYADRLRENGKTPIYCMVAVMHKLLLIARSVLIHGQPYDPEYVGQE
jgi:transposase